MKSRLGSVAAQDEPPPDVVDTLARALGEALAAQFFRENASGQHVLGVTRPGIRQREDRINDGY